LGQERAPGLFRLDRRALGAEASSMLKRCGDCGKEKERADFGRDAHRADGLNIYCKLCTRAKTRAHRANLRGMGRPANVRPQARKPNVIARVRRYRPIPQKVYDAIRAGASSQTEIGRMTGLGLDQVGEALADLLLWQKAIRTELKGERRLYFIKAA
jgi:hypothetical protein